MFSSVVIISSTTLFFNASKSRCSPSIKNVELRSRYFLYCNLVQAITFLLSTEVMFNRDVQFKFIKGCTVMGTVDLDSVKVLKLFDAISKNEEYNSDKN